MGLVSDSAARVDRLRGLYAEQFREPFDAAEFFADDFYAFQVLERVFQAKSKSSELQNLALLMHAERKAMMETGQRRVLEAMTLLAPTACPIRSLAQMPRPCRTTPADSERWRRRNGAAAACA